MKSFSIITLFILLRFNSVGQVLNVTQIIQEQDQWCWAAVSVCILDYYGYNVSQCQVANYTRTNATWHNFGSADCCVTPGQSCNYWNYNYGTPGSIQDILEHFGNIINYGDSNAISLSEVKSNISQNLPFVIRWAWSSGGGHFLVGYGIVDSSLYYMNPWPGEGLQIADYSWVVSGDVHTWTHTNVITTAPSNFYNVSGIITYDNISNSAMKNLQLKLMNQDDEIIDSTITDTTGYYKFSNLSNGNYDLIAITNQPTGGINPIDALIANRAYIKIINITDNLKMIAADVDANGIINPIDALLINRYYIKLVNSFIAGKWYFEPVSFSINNQDTTLNIKSICIGDVNGSYNPK